MFVSRPSDRSSLGNGYRDHREFDQRSGGDGRPYFCRRPDPPIPRTQTSRKHARTRAVVSKPGFHERTSSGDVAPGWRKREKIREVLGPDGEDSVYLVSLTWESIGILLFRRELTLDLVDDFFSGPILLSWQKLKTYSEEFREKLNRDTGSEWFHWLAERMMERERSSPPVPAYIAHRDGGKAASRSCPKQAQFS